MKTSKDRDNTLSTHHSPPATENGSVVGLPVLLLSEGTSLHSNIHVCRRSWTSYLGRTYGQAAVLLDTGKKHCPPLVPKPVVPADADEYDRTAALESHREAVKLHMRETHDLKKRTPASSLSCTASCQSSRRLAYRPPKTGTPCTRKGTPRASGQLSWRPM